MKNLENKKTGTSKIPLVIMEMTLILLKKQTSPRFS